MQIDTTLHTDKEEHNSQQPMSLEYTIEGRRFVQENHDNCSICGVPFPEGSTTHLGYDMNDQLVYVGECCRKILQSTIVRHGHSRRKYSVPSGETVLWRFMDFPKFLHLLETQMLYFSKPSQFRDPFEGAMGSSKNKEAWDKFYLAYCIQVQLHLPDGIKQTKSPEEILAHAKVLLDQINRLGKENLESTLINCWHENPYESEAMWKLYTQHLSSGIAIQTTYHDLYLALGKDPDLSIGRVNYIDFQNQFSDLNGPFWHKRKSFEHEKEVRIIKRFAPNQQVNNQLIPVNLTQLINNVYISPTAEAWFIELVGAVISKYNYSFPIQTSSMNESPFF